MLTSILILAASLAPLAALDEGSGAEPSAIEAVRAQDEALAAAHGRGDLTTYRAGLSKHYVYIDVGGKRVTAGLLSERRDKDQRRLISSESLDDEALQLSDTTVLLRGHERSLSLYYGGLPRVGETRWTALWIKEADGVWRLAGETATPVRESEGLPFVLEPQPTAVLAALAGSWKLATTPALTLNLSVVDDGLRARLDGQSVEWTFRPASARHYFAAERPFELRVSADGRRMDLITWSSVTAATRADEEVDATPIRNDG